MNYKIEVVSIEGGVDVFIWDSARTKKSAINKAVKLSRRHNKKGVNSQGSLNQESVWIERFDEDDLREQWQFVNGEQVYYTSQ